MISMMVDDYCLSKLLLLSSIRYSAIIERIDVVCVLKMVMVVMVKMYINIHCQFLKYIFKYIFIIFFRPWYFIPKV